MTGHDRLPSRRQVLAGLGLGSLGIAAACSPGSTNGGRTAAAPAAPAVRADVDPRRVLVVVELVGGNDGLSTLVPADSGRYHDLRPTVAIPDDRLVPFTDGFALNAQLQPLLAGGLTVVDGIGDRSGTLSHFDMAARWHRGTPGSSDPANTGVLGLVCDTLGEPGQVTGVSIELLPSPMLASRSATTVGLPDQQLLQPPGGITSAALAPLGSALQRFGAADTSGPAPTNASIQQALGLDDFLRRTPELPPLAAEADPIAASFAEKLRTALAIIRADLGVRVIHVLGTPSAFDSHSMHLESHERSLAALVPGLAAFRAELAASGLSDRVLIATTSEFGRRPLEANGGLDHGTSSCSLLMGPTVPGLHGETPSLDRLDQDGNLASPIEFDRYLATLVGWLGVDPEQILGRPVEPLTGVVNA